jgi:hypothetical protein
VGEPIAAEDKQRLEDTAAYLVRNPLSLKRLVYLDGRQAVLYRSRMNPSLGRNFEAMDPLDYGELLESRPRRRPLLRAGHHQRHGRNAAQAALLPKLGQADRQGLPAGSARLRPLRPAHEHPRLRERSALHQPNPRTPRTALAAAGKGRMPVALAGAPCARLALHAERLELEAGGAGRKLCVEAPLAPDLAALADWLDSVVVHGTVRRPAS